MSDKSQYLKDINEQKRQRRQNKEDLYRKIADIIRANPEPEDAAKALINNIADLVPPPIMMPPSIQSNGCVAIEAYSAPLLSYIYHSDGTDEDDNPKGYMPYDIDNAPLVDQRDPVPQTYEEALEILRWENIHAIKLALQINRDSIDTWEPESEPKTA